MAAETEAVAEALTEDEHEMMDAMQNFNTASTVLQRVCVKVLGADPDTWNTRAGVFSRLKAPMMDWWLEKKWKSSGKSGKGIAASLVRFDEGSDLVEAMKKEMKIPVMQSDRDSELGKMKELINRNYNNFLHHEILNPLKAILKVCTSRKRSLSLLWK